MKGQPRIEKAESVRRDMNQEEEEKVREKKLSSSMKWFTWPRAAVRSCEMNRDH